MYMIKRMYMSLSIFHYKFNYYQNWGMLKINKNQAINELNFRLKHQRLFTLRDLYCMTEIIKQESNYSNYYKKLKSLFTFCKVAIFKLSGIHLETNSLNKRNNAVFSVGHVYFLLLFSNKKAVRLNSILELNKFEISLFFVQIM
ncbi:hypothetical protein BpHYR1_038194 [Brachionus plicatilis]|uniref:Uncharacterized protein n=1 Tax=Brachionus plicatilis TaxID=10195 RepID=A0A3M7TAL7_BRAPC|nr:hypothetical protein BpHYR1_038194 [Brachionus plicatilis]